MAYLNLRRVMLRLVQHSGAETVKRHVLILASYFFQTCFSQSNLSGNSNGLSNTQWRSELLLSRIASAAKQFLTGALEEYSDRTEITLVLNFHEDHQGSAITVPVFLYNAIALGISSVST